MIYCILKERRNTDDNTHSTDPKQIIIATVSVAKSCKIFTETLLEKLLRNGIERILFENAL